MSPIITPTPLRLPDEGLRLLGSMRERGLAEHAFQVAALTAGVCRRMRLDEDEAQTVGLAALMHDVGKLVLAQEILDHPGPLSPVAVEALRRHPGLGERLLRCSPGLEDLASLVRHSHERWDGTGYPDGLRGVEIPMGSRIIAACDAWDAMRSDRSYQPARSHEEAVGTLVEAAGVQFDPEVVSVVLAHVTRGTLR